MTFEDVNIRQRIPEPPRSLQNSKDAVNRDLGKYLSEFGRSIDRALLYLSDTDKRVRSNFGSNVPVVDIGWDGSTSPSGYTATGVPGTIAYDPDVGFVVWWDDPNIPYVLTLKRIGQSSGPPPFSGSITLGTGQTLSVSNGLIVSVS